jgi:hypothetical protein
MRPSWQLRSALPSAGVQGHLAMTKDPATYLAGPGREVRETADYRAERTRDSGAGSRSHHRRPAKYIFRSPAKGRPPTTLHNPGIAFGAVPVWPMFDHCHPKTDYADLNPRLGRRFVMRQRDPWRRWRA